MMNDDSTKGSVKNIEPIPSSCANFIDIQTQPVKSSE